MKSLRIIISPAKKMNVNTDIFSARQLPEFLDKTKKLLSCLQGMDYEKVKAIWKCSDSIASLNFGRIRQMHLTEQLTPAILSYEGIQYQYMAPGVFTEGAYGYLEEHLRILSGFYGVLRPFDGVRPYRLEMQARLGTEETDSLYDFWGDSLADSICREASCIINLASREYSRAVSSYLPPDMPFIPCVFGQRVDGRIKEKGTMCKMARGEMVRYMAENRIENSEEIKNFDRLNYSFCEEQSDEKTFVFLKDVSEGRLAGKRAEKAE